MTPDDFNQTLLERLWFHDIQRDTRDNGRVVIWCKRCEQMGSDALFSGICTFAEVDIVVRERQRGNDVMRGIEL
jgi:hypothetical protein